MFQTFHIFAKSTFKKYCYFFSGYLSAFGRPTYRTLKSSEIFIAKSFLPATLHMCSTHDYLLQPEFGRDWTSGVRDITIWICEKAPSHKAISKCSPKVSVTFSQFFFYVIKTPPPLQMFYFWLSMNVISSKQVSKQFFHPSTKIYDLASTPGVVPIYSGSDLQQILENHWVSSDLKYVPGAYIKLYGSPQCSSNVLEGFWRKSFFWLIKKFSSKIYVLGNFTVFLHFFFKFDLM